MLVLKRRLFCVPIQIGLSGCLVIVRPEDDNCGIEEDAIKERKSAGVDR